MANTTSNDLKVDFENYFSKLFPTLILKNKLVATILNVFMNLFSEQVIKIEKRTTTDI